MKLDDANLGVGIGIGAGGCIAVYIFVRLLLCVLLGRGKSGKVAPSSPASSLSGSPKRNSSSLKTLHNSPSRHSSSPKIFDSHGKPGFPRNASESSLSEEEDLERAPTYADDREDDDVSSEEEAEIAEEGQRGVSTAIHDNFAQYEAELVRVAEANKALEEEVSMLREKLGRPADADSSAGAPITKPHFLAKRQTTKLMPPAKVEMEEPGLRLWVANAVGIPKMDRYWHSDTYVVAEIKGAQPKIRARTRISTGAAPKWNQVITLSGDPSQWDPATTSIRIRLWDQDSTTSEFIGQVEILLIDLIRRPVRRLLVSKKNGDPVISHFKPPVPCEINIGVIVASCPATWPAPTEHLHDGMPVEDFDFPKHVFMMTRGTRGDVQPFVALARGMAQNKGWLVTICTELEFRGFVHQKSKGLTRGAIRFLPSGGDTAKRIERWEARQFMQAKTELAEMLMLAFSEASFFASATVFVHQIEMLKKDRPVDLIVNAFTLTGVAMLASERCDVPMAGFLLQPTCVPSRDPTWKAIEEIESHGTYLGCIDYLESKLFTGHRSLARLKAAAEKNPLAKISLPRLRYAFGLAAADTWPTLQSQDVPMVIPMKSGTFPRPSDWPTRTIMSDFIFLRMGTGNTKGELPPELRSFIDDAKAAGRALCVMTFSSMPVARKKMLGAVVEMLTKGAHPFSLIYVGKRFNEPVPARLQSAVDHLMEQGRFLELASADFGVLFAEMDAFIVHGGLGTTVEALRMRKPVAVTGPLLMDQRFWGGVCHQKGVGPPPTHIDDFRKHCVRFVDDALAPSSQMRRTAAALDFGDEDDDGVESNVDLFERLMQSGIKPVHTARAEASIFRSVAKSTLLTKRASALAFKKAAKLKDAAKADDTQDAEVRLSSLTDRSVSRSLTLPRVTEEQSDKALLEDCDELPTPSHSRVAAPVSAPITEAAPLSVAEPARDAPVLSAGSAQVVPSETPYPEPPVSPVGTTTS